ncbi:MAG: phosphoribosylamine--glycine ligase [Omnitrophica bacterium RIFCSPLOWO2_12_FULL_44_17]|uniref:Phosphoribosylamine--glycine ligase n=1 Tax=Candidatus Danuiimicrobium aquiferis TaxID=1801832 RepID=A0A1G1KWE8_9BACT|nr:MAG: phosphoribosylamine--glycine ligase [Omnitrophica bacterium RIFCSPHIGHO2_02_FULL_45_28]OGW90268.1 MAG: phosphoribosylamine--glycine ligase [Omnitrophica bacterium RIFCSPHIGHO2_12_FULL_44_12]OGW97243.1 MAG: phosphoribosylamine--glycine ligase [Omnitrophica bacterium RIFCSPLOWO2_12_FULL_44_17]OGX02298.1 MAG: phosphoribosylamine--glycine ligase [Omnitrophica bacterium RIFCSPLOWO2_02_FULL_44_11]
MKVLVIGSGGREHALVWKIKQSPLVEKIYVAPGNAGISQIAECVNINIDQYDRMIQFAESNHIDLTVVGPEKPLADGIVNRFRAKKLKIFGPVQEAAQLEGSKVFSKRIMAEAHVPTAVFEVFNSVDQAEKFICKKNPPFVIKADGLAAGKGVVISETREDANKTVRNIIQDRMFGESGKQIVIEEFLRGDELSVLLLTDGETIIPLASSQDHKRAYDNDEGPNTGGMGAYSPCSFVTDKDLKSIVEKTARPTIETLKRKGIIYQGLLYVGIMMTANGPYVLEYNVRFGDPETEAVLPRMKSDIVPVMVEIAEGKLKTKKLEWDSRVCMTVVLASEGYPGDYPKDREVKGLSEIKDDQVSVFHAGTSFNPAGQMVTSGGRILAVSSLGIDHQEAYDRVYRSISKIKIEGAFYRKDIGKRVFEKTKAR